ncbi:uncharacterized protein LOC120589130 isoform X2 [Pteropus medius]|uniref:uncharacterized protein LOC120589130 isoform X2 n=1 Tax=Pteropus vampyrus TaxID=132908 RepID=UPI00196A58CB|nr:uncharacterized protein LOC120589130 isoform X2 [Pteropus giganteus]
MVGSRCRLLHPVAQPCPWASALDLASPVSRVTVCNRFHEETSSACGLGSEAGTDLTGWQRAGQNHPPIRAHPLPGPTVAFVLRGRTSGAVAMVSRAELRKLRVPVPVPVRRGLSGRSPLLVTVTVIRVASACTIGVFPPPPTPRKPANERDFLPVAPSPSFSDHQMALWSHEGTRSPPFLLRKKKEEEEEEEEEKKQQKKSGATFSGTIGHISFWACLSQACPEAQLLLPSVAS